MDGRSQRNVAGSISVVIPTHNRRRMLRRALQSVRDQSYAPIEVIVVDDGSTDNSSELVIGEFPEVSYRRQPHRGVSAARNLGIEASRGEWLAFLDSDDEWLPAKLGKQMEELTKHAEYRMCHTNERWIRNGRRVNQGRRHAKHGGWIYQECLPLCAISPSSSLIHRSILEEIGTFDEEMEACEDYDLWLRIASRYPVLLVDEPLTIKHGGHTDQLSRTVCGLDRFRIRALEKILRSSVLNEVDTQATLATLQDKLAVYMHGSVKRGKLDEVDRLNRIKTRWGLAG